MTGDHPSDTEPSDLDGVDDPPEVTAYGRLYARGYGSSVARMVGAPEIMMAVVRMLTEDPSAAYPSREDVADALRLGTVVGETVEAARLALIQAARAGGMTWPEIGTLIGMQDRRTAQRHYIQLKARVTARAAADTPTRDAEGR